MTSSVYQLDEVLSQTASFGIIDSDRHLKPVWSGLEALGRQTGIVDWGDVSAAETLDFQRTSKHTEYIESGLILTDRLCRFRDTVEVCQVEGQPDKLPSFECRDFGIEFLDSFLSSALASCR
jgi:hypothetical protein